MLARIPAALLSVFFLLPASPGDASMVRKMDLAEMCNAAGRIVRGVVVDIEKVKVPAGGGQLSGMRYHVDISERFKGAFPDAKSEGNGFSFTMVDIPALEMPGLTVGQDYLLILTTPSAAGLSTMVGLGQGTFKVYGARNEEMAVNSLNNVGLVNGLTGPLPYQALAKRIRAIL